MQGDTSTPSTQAAGHGRRRTLLAAVVAVLVFCALQWAWEQARGTAIERVVVHHLTVDTAVMLINLATPAVQSHGVGPSIKAAGGGINIRNGCEGTEVLFLLAAALAATPGPWRARCWGLLAGTVVVFALNQLRVIALFYSFRHDQALFSQLHSLITPALMVAGALLFYVAWTEGMWRRSRRQGGADTASAA